MKRVMILILACIVGVAGVGCGKQYKEKGNFIYEVVTSVNGNKLEQSEYYVQLRELSEEGKQQKYIVVPKEIDGYPVKYIGYNNIAGGMQGEWNSDVLNKIYFSQSYTILSDGCIGTCPNLEKILFVEKKHMSVHFFEKHYHPIANDAIAGNKANVTFYYNYPEAPNMSVYWIDDLDNEIIEVIPEAPIREGYIFDGWYKEPKGINPWDFETDIVPAKEYDENGEYIYHETCLYAKWVAE